MTYSMRYQDREPTPRPRPPRHEALNASVEIAYQLGCASPLVAARTLARALKTQTRGAQLIAIRELCTALNLRDEVIAEFKKLGD